MEKQFTVTHEEEASTEKNLCNVFGGLCVQHLKAVMTQRVCSPVEKHLQFICLKKH